MKIPIVFAMMLAFFLVLYGIASLAQDLAAGLASRQPKPAKPEEESKMPKPVSPKVAKLEDFSDDEIDNEFKRRAAMQMRPVNERAVKLAKDAWSDRREW